MEISSESESKELSRRKIITAGAVAGVGLLSIPLPAAAIATSGSGGAGNPEPEYWAMNSLSVADMDDGMTSFSLFVIYDPMGLSRGTQSWFVRIYRVSGGNYFLAADGSTGDPVVVSGTFDGYGSTQVMIVNATHTFLSGTYAARLFVNQPTNAPDSAFQLEISKVQ